MNSRFDPDRRARDNFRQKGIRSEKVNGQHFAKKSKNNKQAVSARIIFSN